MNVIKRKNTPPTQFGRSSNGEGKFRFMLQIKLALVLLCAGLDRKSTRLNSSHRL